MTNNQNQNQNTTDLSLNVQQELIKSCIIDVPADELSLNTVVAAIMADKKAATNVHNVALKLNRTPAEIASIASILSSNEIDADKDPAESLEDSVYIDAAVETARSAVLKMLIDNHLLTIKLQKEVDAAAKKTTVKAPKTVVLNDIQHSLLKNVVDRCKVYRDAAGNPVPERVPDETGKLKNNPAAVSYTIEPEQNPVFNCFSDVESKISDIVSWFAPNAKKTGKVCATATAEAVLIIKKSYKRAVRAMVADLPVFTDDLIDLVPVEAPAAVPANAPAAVPANAPAESTGA